MACRSLPTRHAPARGTRRALRRWTFQPALEALEGRLAPAAGVFTVTTLADDGSAGSLRGAVNQADKFIGAAQIVFAVNGVFKLTQFNDPTAGPSPDTGDIEITNNTTFVGNGIQQTIIDANHLDRAFWISGPLTVNFNDLAIRNGIAGRNSTGLTATTTGSEGGAVYAASAGATLNFTNVAITGNQAQSNGGAIAATSAVINLTNAYMANNQCQEHGGALSVDTGAAVTITNSHLELNSAGFSGGAVNVGTNDGPQPTLTITGSLLNNNRALVSAGGAVNDSSSSPGGVFLFNSSLVNNYAAFVGGGIWTVGDVTIDGDGGAPLAIDGRNNLGFNTAGTYGGSVMAQGGDVPSTVTVRNTNLSANRAGSSGGAIYSQDLATSITNTLMVDNSVAVYGGAVLDAFTSGATLAITDSVLNNNAAGTSGGAVWTSAAHVQIDHCRFDFNVAAGNFIGALLLSNGGAIVSYDNGDSTLTLSNCDLDDNRAAGLGGGVATSSDTATFTNDNIIGNIASREGGGGIAAIDTLVTITDSRIIGNTAGGDMDNSFGGGIYASHQPGGSVTVRLTNDVVSSNTALRRGGGVYVDAGPDGAVAIDGCTIQRNTALRGGGVQMIAPTMSVTDSAITDNSANLLGGGIRALGTGSTLTLIGDLVSGNTAGTSGGGVYYFDGTGTLLGNADTFSRNTAGLDGGGVWTDAAEVDFVPPGLGSLFSANAAGLGGGAFFRSFDGTAADVGATFTNVTFAANTAAASGGAVYSAYGNTTAAGSAKLVLMNDTLNLNAAGKGSAVFAANLSTNAGSASTVTVTNTIIAGAPPGAGPHFGTSGAGVAFDTEAPGSNLTDDPNDLTTNGGVLSGFAANNVGLGPLQDNGGPTFTFALLPGSPAIDAATADQNPATGVPNADQRGVPRPQPVPGGTVDIGAFEAVPGDFLIAAGPDVGNSGAVAINVYQAVPTNAGPPPLVGTVAATDFKGGVHLALADVNDDGVPDLVVGSGPGQAPLVEVFSLNASNGTFGSRIGSKIVPYNSAFQGGVYVAGGQFNNDKHADVVVGPGAGGGPEVKVFTLYQPGTDTLLGTPAAVPIVGTGPDGGFNAFAASFTGGVSVGVTDANGDGQDDVIVGQASAGGSFAVFDGRDVRGPLFTAQAFGSAFTGGVNVAGGNFGRTVDGVTQAAVTGDIVVGQASGGGSVKVFDGDTHTQVGNAINPFGSGYTGGVSVATVQDTDGNTVSEIVVGQTSGQGLVKMIDGSSFAFLDTFFANTAFTSGVAVGGGF